MSSPYQCSVDTPPALPVERRRFYHRLALLLVIFSTTLSVTLNTFDHPLTEIEYRWVKDLVFLALVLAFTWLHIVSRSVWNCPCCSTPLSEKWNITICDSCETRFDRGEVKWDEDDLKVYLATYMVIVVSLNLIFALLRGIGVSILSRLKKPEVMAFRETNMETTDQNEFNRWLEEQEWLEDCWVTEIVPPPGPGNPEISTGTISLKVWSSGELDAGSKRVWANYRLTVESVSRWYLHDEAAWSPENCCQCVEPLDSPDSISFLIDVPGDFEVLCKSITCERLADSEDTVQAWLSATEFSATVPNMPLPTPSEWVSWFADAGYEVAWRYLHGEAKPADAVPLDDYSGWFLQLVDLIPRTKGGLWFRACHLEGDSLHLLLQDPQGDQGDLGAIAGRILSTHPGIEVHSGNCVLNAEQWNSFLHDGKIPEMNIKD